MCARKLQPDDLDIDEDLVRRLLEAQFPHWADLPLEEVESSGTDNVIFRLGKDKAVRLPRRAWAGAPESRRGAPLATRDAATRESIAALDGLLDAEAVTRAWEVSLDAPAWNGPPLWTHGDLAPGNLLAADGRLTAVIDFGGLGVGDPACDLMVAWNFLSAQTRNVFRSTLGVDDATWARGRGCALSGALVALPRHLHTNPVLVANCWRVIDEILADQTRP